VFDLQKRLKKLHDRRKSSPLDYLSGGQWREAGNPRWRADANAALMIGSPWYHARTSPMGRLLAGRGNVSDLAGLSRELLVYKTPPPDGGRMVLLWIAV
jgi:hypothetical protein